MVRPPHMQRLDRQGVDLCVPDSDGHFSVVVQAKGFKADERLLPEQVRAQIIPSIRKFLKSTVTCDEYILLHNRDGRDRSLAGIIQKELDALVAAGKARTAKLCDRFALVKHAREHLYQRIQDKLIEHSRRTLRQQESFFHFGKLFVSNVPLSQTSWNPASQRPQALEPASFTTSNAAELIASARHVRYTILIGSFGIGKTTTVLHAADAKGALIVYVPAHTIRRDQGGQGTNYLLGNLNEELDLLEDFCDDTAGVLNDVIGGSIGRVFRQSDNPFVLVIDGLDEHGVYGTPYGLQWLTNELAELRCPVVLTTRREHFLGLLGNYALAAENLSKKGGAGRVVEILQLGTWSARQARLLLTLAIDTTSDKAAAEELTLLLKSISSDNSPIAARLLNHPLFLQMTMDLIMDGEQ